MALVPAYQLEDVIATAEMQRVDRRLGLSGGPRAVGSGSPVMPSQPFRAGPSRREGLHGAAFLPFAG